MEHNSDDDTNCHWLPRYNHERIRTGIRKLGNKRKSGDYSIVKIGKNTKKSPGGLRTCCNSGLGEIASAYADVSTNNTSMTDWPSK